MLTYTCIEISGRLAQEQYDKVGMGGGERGRGGKGSGFRGVQGYVVRSRGLQRSGSGEYKGMW